ncbi:MAG: type II CRISPR-associated endonuclease Cas1 [Armatimonadetes bacterium]|nr:type II CRISPR-associated endonuclease Cas1 [Armatimonadota bacterium]NIO96520.1 type II CRISPR-associated endonuclease Cas1 [Armatimonadota bacterium]
MTERIIDLAEGPARLSVQNACLLIRSGERLDYTVPLGEVGVLVVSNPCVTFTHAVLSGLAQAGASMVVCDSKHMPAAMLLPLEGHFAQGERFALQAQISLPTRKRLWKSVVQAKIRAQGRLLAELRGFDAGLSRLAAEVRSGDSGNHEAEASRRYWPVLFDDKEFRRDRYALDQNRLLNYGYAVVRAIVARGVCAAGLHPSLGLHHHNRYDAFRLVDDLMEPFRPLVDRAVVLYCEKHGTSAPLGKRAKAFLVGSLMERFSFQKKSRTLFDIAARTAASLAAILFNKRKNLLLPDLFD